MKDILIIFCILLVLLLIISSLGGSVRPNEAFVSQVASEEAVVKRYLDDPHRHQAVSYAQYEVADEQPHKKEHFAAAEVQAEERQVNGFDGADVFATY